MENENKGNVFAIAIIESTYTTSRTMYPTIMAYVFPDTLCLVRVTVFSELFFGIIVVNLPAQYHRPRGRLFCIFCHERHISQPQPPLLFTRYIAASASWKSLSKLLILAPYATPQLK